MGPNCLKDLHLTSLVCQAVVVLVVAQSTWAGERSIFFRWGPQSTNQTILEKGDYNGDSASHDRDLSHGQWATYTPELYQQLAAWNIKNTDAAGTGLYASKDLFDSLQFGGEHPGLLIVETKNESLFKNYAGNWHIAKTPSSEVLIRPPNADDVERVWQQWLNEKNIYKRIETTAMITMDSYNKKFWPRSSQIFLERLSFDYAAKFLAVKSQDPKELIEAKFGAAMESVVNLLLEKAPDHEAMKSLFPIFMKTLGQKKSFLQKIFSERPKAAVNLWKKLGSDWTPSLFQILSEQLTSSRGLTSPTEIFNQCSEFLSEAQANTLRTILSVRISQALALDGSSEFFQNIEKILGPDARRRAEHGYKISAVRTMLGDTRLIDAQPPSLRYEAAETLKKYALDLIQRQDPSVFDIANSLIKSQTTEKIFILGVGHQYLYLKTISELSNLSPNTASSAKEFLTESDAAIEKMILQGKSRNSDFIDNILSEAVKMNNSPEFLQNIVREITQRHPNTKQTLELQLQRLRSSPAFENQPFRLKISDILSDLRNITSTSEIVERNMTLVKNLSTAKIRNRIMTTTNWENLYSTIGPSIEYSRISRLFSLVDPILVSEDIRILNASKPWLRYNESYHTNGKTYQQPAWSNFVQTWENKALALVSGNSDAPYQIGLELLSGFVDGQGNPIDLKTNDIDLSYRSGLKVEIPKNDWDDKVSPETQKELTKFFDIEILKTRVEMKFKPIKNLVSDLGFGYYPNRRLTLQEFVGQISSQVNKIQNPVERAVEILYLTTKIHPFNNGNGRLTRFWASAVLMAAGYPPPVGLPTNDFLMSKNRLRLEVRKAVALGKLWKEMLQDAERRKVSAEEFFQKIYRSSGLEGLILYTPKTDSALEDWVTRLETIERLEKIPSWALKLNRDIEERIREVHKNGGNMANTNELEQFKLLSQISEKYPMAKPQVSRATRIPICQKAFLP